MKPIRRRGKGKRAAFDCPWNGHEPLEGLPQEVAQVGPIILKAFICRKCMCTCYEYMGQASGLVSPEGAAIAQG